jgi:uncharacterized membrane protein YkvI
MRYWPVLVTAIVLAALFAPFGITPLPWRSWQYFAAALFTLLLLTLVFVRRRRSRIA